MATYIVDLGRFSVRGDIDFKSDVDMFCMKDRYVHRYVDKLNPSLSLNMVTHEG